MRALRALLFRLGGLFRKAQSERELADEFETHLEMQIEENIRSGMTHEQARRQALIKSGGLEPAREAYRDRRGLPIVDTGLRDIRFSIRIMRKNVGFTAVVAVTLALGIGANTAIFSAVHAALTPLAVPASDRVVMVWTENAKRDWHQFPASVPDFVDWKTSGIFESLGAFKEAGFNVRLSGRTERINGVRVTKVIGRIRPGISLASAQKRMDEVSHRLGEQYPGDDSGNSARLQLIEEAFVEGCAYSAHRTVRRCRLRAAHCFRQYRESLARARHGSG
jgi:hypothetical protein